MNQEPLLSEWIAHKLLFELKNGIYKDAVKIPPEVEIARTLGVSRTILRDALSKMEQEGFISRRQGFGTLVNRHVLEVSTRMDLEEEFLSMIRTAGKYPKTEFCTAKRIPAAEDIARSLMISPGEELIVIRRLISANGVPAIYCYDHFPVSLIKIRDYDEKVLINEPIFNFLERYCDTAVYMDLTEVRAVAASEDVSEALEILPNSPVLFMNEVGYDFKGKPVLNSFEYYRDRVLHHTVLRKKI